MRDASIPGVWSLDRAWHPPASFRLIELRCCAHLYGQGVRQIDIAEQFGRHKSRSGMHSGGPGCSRCWARPGGPFSSGQFDEGSREPG